MSLRKLVVKFLQRTKLNKLAHKAYYNYVHGFNPATKEIIPALETAFEKAIELGIVHSGDYYEFGVFKGYAFWYTQNLANKYGLKKMKFWGFDSFQGLPRVQGRDQTQAEDFYEGQYACTKASVVNNLNTNGGIDWNRTTLIEGFFADSLTAKTKQEYNLNKVAIALIDCDLYSSTVEVLEFIKDLLADETILIFDDWNCFDSDDEKGQRKAFREFLDTNNHFAVESLFTYGLYGQAFLVKQQSLSDKVNYSDTNFQMA